MAVEVVAQPASECRDIESILRRLEFRELYFGEIFVVGIEILTELGIEVQRTFAVPFLNFITMGIVAENTRLDDRLRGAGGGNLRHQRRGHLPG